MTGRKRRAYPASAECSPSQERGVHHAAAQPRLNAGLSSVICRSYRAAAGAWAAGASTTPRPRRRLLRGWASPAARAAVQAAGRHRRLHRRRCSFTAGATMTQRPRPPHNGPGWGSPASPRRRAAPRALREDVDALARTTDVADGGSWWAPSCREPGTRCSGPRPTRWQPTQRRGPASGPACSASTGCARIELTCVGATGRRPRRVHAAQGARAIACRRRRAGPSVAKGPRARAEVDVEAEGGSLAVVREVTRSRRPVVEKTRFHPAGAPARTTPITSRDQAGCPAVYRPPPARCDDDPVSLLRGEDDVDVAATGRPVRDDVGHGARRRAYVQCDHPGAHTRCTRRSTTAPITPGGGHRRRPRRHVPQRRRPDYWRPALLDAAGAGVSAPPRDDAPCGSCSCRRR